MSQVCLLFCFEIKIYSTIRLTNTFSDQRLRYGIFHAFSFFLLKSKAWGFGVSGNLRFGRVLFERCPSAGTVQARRKARSQKLRLQKFGILDKVGMRTPHTASPAERAAVFKRSAHSAGPTRYTRLYGWIGLFANLLVGAEGFSIFGDCLAL